MTDEEKRKKDFAEKLAYWRKNGAPGIISDTPRDPIKSMADGKIYDSKSAYEKSLKEQGYQIVGNEKPTSPQVKQSSDDEIVADICKTAAQLGHDI